LNQALYDDEIEEKVLWLALQDSTWIVPTQKIVSVFRKAGSLSPLFERSIHLRDLDLDYNSMRKLWRQISSRSKADLLRTMEYLRKNGVRLIRYIDEEYPQYLKDGLNNPPLLLFQKGRLLNFDNCVAVAGTRDCSWYGRQMTRRIAKAIASEGYTVVSGLARGTDEWAHFGALEARKGKSIAVLPWMQPVYPAEHSILLDNLMENGAAISELLDKPSGGMAKAKFVQRNRITSGISCCLVAMESGEEGGTAHQVKIAINQGRKVFVLKPKSNEKFKKGFKKFVDIGASPLKDVKDVLKYLRAKAPLKFQDRKLDSYYQHRLE